LLCNYSVRCSTYNDQKLQVFTSSLFLAGLVSSLFAGHITRHFGRKVRAAWQHTHVGLPSTLRQLMCAELHDAV
jgi:hypothetical protein